MQFGFIEESLQIPFLAVCGLVWTFIISLFAGNAKKSYSEEESVAAVVSASVQEHTTTAHSASHSPPSFNKEHTQANGKYDLVKEKELVVR